MTHLTSKCTIHHIIWRDMNYIHKCSMIDRKTNYIGVERWCWMEASTCAHAPMVCWMMMWMKEMLNQFNMLNVYPECTHDKQWKAETSACKTRADRSAWTSRRRREKMLRWSRDWWKRIRNNSVQVLTKVMKRWFRGKEIGGCRCSLFLVFEINK